MIQRPAHDSLNRFNPSVMCFRVKGSIPETRHTADHPFQALRSESRGCGYRGGLVFKAHVYQLRAQGPSRTCNESEEEEDLKCDELGAHSRPPALGDI